MSPLLTRFLAKVRKSESGCWIWTAAVRADGYGNFRGPSSYLAHRTAYELWVGPIGDKLVLHKCDNRLCVRPDHLFLGNNDDNSKDMVAKGRQARGEKQGSSQLTDEKVRAIQFALSLGITHNRIAAQHGICRSLVSMINTRKRWRHL